MLNDTNSADEYEYNFADEYEYNFVDEDERRNSIRAWLAVFAIFAALFACVNFLTVFLIFRFKKLRKLPANVILAHLNILQGVACLASTVVVGLVLFEWSEVTHLLQQVLCHSQEASTALFLGTDLFQFQLLLEWYLRTYSSTGRHQKFCRIYMFLIFFIDFILLSWLLVSFQFCYKLVFLPTTFASAFSYLLLILFVIIFNVVNLIKHRNVTARKNNVALAVITISTTCRGPDIINFLIFVFSRNFHLHISLISQLVGHFSSVLVLLYLYFCDEYRVFFKYVLACSHEYSNEILEEEAQVAFEETNLDLGGIRPNSASLSS